MEDIWKEISDGPRHRIWILSAVFVFVMMGNLSSESMLVWKVFNCSYVSIRFHDTEKKKITNLCFVGAPRLYGFCWQLVNWEQVWWRFVHMTQKNLSHDITRFIAQFISYLYDPFTESPTLTSDFVWKFCSFGSWTL